MEDGKVEELSEGVMEEGLSAAGCDSDSSVCSGITSILEELLSGWLYCCVMAGEVGDWHAVNKERQDKHSNTAVFPRRKKGRGMKKGLLLLRKDF